MKKTIDNVTGVVVSYHYPKLIQDSVNSILKFYPDMKILILDGSPKNSPCIPAVKKLAADNKNVTGIIYNKNIGHGIGMHEGIKKATTDFVLVFDSDIVLLEPKVESMLDAFDHDEVLCAGQMVFIERGGHGWYPGKKMSVTRENGGCPYIHPYFEMINRKEYFKYQPFKHHGSPCIHTMYDVFNKGLSDKVLRSFPEVTKFVHHDPGGTRHENPPEFFKGWEQYKGPGK